jgi:hypothetical protein
MKPVSEAQAASHLFTLRVWQEEVGHGRAELRGALTHVLTGKTGYCRDWTTLVRLIEPFVAPVSWPQMAPEPSMEEVSSDNSAA